MIVVWDGDPIFAKLCPKIMGRYYTGGCGVKFWGRLRCDFGIIFVFWGAIIITGAAGKLWGNMKGNSEKCRYTQSYIFHIMFLIIWPYIYIYIYMLLIRKTCF